MQNHKAALALIGLSLLSNFVCAQQPKAIAKDSPANPSIPSQNVETIIYSDGSRLMGMFLLASGAETHRTVILLHGFPGYEQNMDLAQALRRDGWNVLAVHYRGAWGSEGSFSFTHCMQDIGVMLTYVRTPATATKFRIDTRKIVVIGHSMGGFLAAAAMAQHPEFSAGVIITEGSPVNDAAGYFGKESDPADYAPLAGTSPAALEGEAKTNTAAWSFDVLAPKISPRPVLVLSANDGLRASNEALRTALTRAGSPVTYAHMDTDHGFSDHRILLQSRILEWLDKMVR
jgi:pimeloyl-ACP methyl ester carboxylesterase